MNIIGILFSIWNNNNKYLYSALKGPHGTLHSKVKQIEATQI